MAAPIVTMQAPATFGGTVSSTPSGTVYVPNAQGLVLASVLDVAVLSRLGFVTVNYPGQVGILGRLLGANMNSVLDQPFVMLVSTTTRFRVSKITATNASVSLTAAAGGVYTAAAKAAGQGVLVASTQVYSALTAPGVALDLTLALQLRLSVGTPVFLSLTTAQGAAATADLYLFGDVISQ